MWGILISWILLLNKLMMINSLHLDSVYHHLKITVCLKIFSCCSDEVDCVTIFCCNLLLSSALSLPADNWHLETWKLLPWHCSWSAIFHSKLLLISTKFGGAFSSYVHDCQLHRELMMKQILLMLAEMTLKSSVMRLSSRCLDESAHSWITRLHCVYLTFCKESKTPSCSYSRRVRLVTPVRWI